MGELQRGLKGCWYLQQSPHHSPSALALALHVLGVPGVKGTLMGGESLLNCRCPRAAGAAGTPPEPRAGTAGLLSSSPGGSHACHRRLLPVIYIRL